MSRRLGLIAVVLFLLSGAYTAYWYEVAARAQAALATWQDSARASGAKVEGTLSREGFPFTITLKLKNFIYERTDALRVTAPLLKVTLPGLTPFRPTISSDENCVFYFARANYTITTQRLSATLLKPWITPKSYRDTGFVLKLALYNVGLDPAHKVSMGNLVQEISFRAKLMGVMPDVSSRVSLESWRDAGGIIDLDKLNILWGSLTMSGQGTLALDKNFQPASALSMNISGYEQSLDVMREQGQLQPLAASLIKAALKMLESPNTPPAQPKKITIPISIQNNALAAAGVNLFTWEPYPWP